MEIHQLQRQESNLRPLPYESNMQPPTPHCDIKPPIFTDQWL